jgi:hypothetical protein
MIRRTAKYVMALAIIQFHTINLQKTQVLMGNKEENYTSLSHKERDKTRLDIENHVSNMRKFLSVMNEFLLVFY